MEHSGYKILKQSGRKYFVSYLYSAKTDWTYVSFFPYSDIYGQVQTVRTLLILGFLAVFTALVFFMIFREQEKCSLIQTDRMR